MTGTPLGIITIDGHGFDQSSEALIDGIQMPGHFLDSDHFEVFLPDTLLSQPGIHQFSVKSTTGIASNALPFTPYAPQQGPLVMYGAPAFWVGNFAYDPSFIVAADLNGDGRAEVILPGPGLSNSPASIAIFYGEADGTLSPVHYLPTTASPYALAAGDVDGDGKADLVSITTGGTQGINVEVLLGDGTGNVHSAGSLQSIFGNYPGPAYLIDIDGDGRPDLVLEYELNAGGGSNLAWLKNTGQGGFAPPVILASMAAGMGPLFTMADFNGDGRPDFVYTTAASPATMRMLLSQGGGNYSDQAITGLNGIVGTVNALDFNLDGHLDLVIQVQEIPSIAVYSFEGDGGGAFTQVASTNIGSPGFAPYQFVVGDFDGDGFPDLAGVNGETEPSHALYLFGDGHGNFTPQEVVGPQGFYAAVGDVNGDGIPDVVVPDRFNFVSLSLGRRDRNFPSALSLSPAFDNGIAVGDIDGDGWPDLLFGGYPLYQVPGTVFQNLRNNSFQVAAYADPGSFELADFSGKGVVDLVSGVDLSLLIYPNNGTFNFGPSPITVSQSNTGPATPVDIDADGHIDIVEPGQIFYGDGKYNFTPIANASLGPYLLADFNGDGRLDISAGGNTFFNQGNRTFSQVQKGYSLDNGALAVVADFNGDGIQDIAVNLAGDTTILISYGNGDGTFYPATVVDAGQYPGALSVGDFDGDGRPDIAVGLTLSHQVCILFNSANNQFTRSFFASGADNGGSIVTADLNRDGKPDLVMTNFMLGYRPVNADVLFHK